jgi:hypothetical protein
MTYGRFWRNCEGHGSACAGARVHTVPDDHELYSLGTGHDKVARCRLEGLQKFQEIRALGFGNHAAFQLSAMALSRR